MGDGEAGLYGVITVLPRRYGSGRSGASSENLLPRVNAANNLFFKVSLHLQCLSESIQRFSRPGETQQEVNFSLIVKLMTQRNSFIYM